MPFVGIAATDTGKEQSKIAGLSVPGLVKYDNKQESRNRKKAAKAALAGTRAILKAREGFLHILYNFIHKLHPV